MSGFASEKLKKIAVLLSPSFRTSAEDSAPHRYQFAELHQARAQKAADSFGIIHHNKPTPADWVQPQYDIRRNWRGKHFTPRLRDIEIGGGLRSDTQERFITSAREALDMLPTAVKMVLAEFGFKVRLSNLMTDFDPAYATMLCRGQDAFVVNTSGLYLPGQATALVTQGCRTKCGAYMDCTHSTEGTVLHEAGHGIEDILFNFAESQEKHVLDFIEAYWQDVEDLKGATQVHGYSLKYYLPQGRGGTHDNPVGAYSETLSELISEIMPRRTRLLQSAFSRTSGIIHETIRALDRYVMENPTTGNLFMPQSVQIPVLTDVYQPGRG